MTPTIAVIDAPVVDPVRVLSILLRCKASRFLNCRDSRYGEPLNPAEPATANALNVGNFQGTQSQHVGRAGDALLLGARFSCAKTEDPASSSVAIVTGQPALHAEYAPTIPRSWSRRPWPLPSRPIVKASTLVTTSR